MKDFPKGTKTLIENSDWAISETVLLANVGHSASEYRFAVEAALKNNLNNILIDSLDDLKSGIEYLKKNEIGKASFYLLGYSEKNNIGLLNKLQNWKTKRNAKNIISEIGVLGFASDFVETDAKWQPYFANLLSNVVIINTLETAIDLSERYSDAE